MKKNLIIVMTFLSMTVSAQWTRTAPNVYLTTITDKVGIGTQTPKAKLDVFTPLTALGTYESQYWSTDNPGYSLKLQSTWSNSYGITQEFVQKSAGTDYPVLSFYSGRVGVGTSAPTVAKFEVNYNIPSQGTYDVQQWSVGNASNTLRLQGIWDNNGISQRMVQRVSGTDYPVLTFYNGNVGIGVPNPGVIDAKLAVKGLIHAQEVVIDLNGAVAPDYVFEDSYKLPTLSEIEEYIAANKHLPEVPSAATMETSGINVGELNLILLKKIEELTLHVILQEKAIAIQAQQLQELKKHLGK